jgi:hypothetical protein
MKRTVILLLTVVYLFSSLGVTAKSMYCMGVLTSTTLTLTDAKAPCKMAADKHKCCKTKTQYFKVKDQHYGSATMAFLAKLFPVLSNYILTDTVPVQHYSQCHAYNSNAPPKASPTPVYILHCTYRI